MVQNDIIGVFDAAHIGTTHIRVVARRPDAPAPGCHHRRAHRTTKIDGEGKVFFMAEIAVITLHDARFKTLSEWDMVRRRLLGKAASAGFKLRTGHANRRGTRSRAAG